MSFGGKFKLYTVLNGLIFPTSTQPRISFERDIKYVLRKCEMQKLKKIIKICQFVPVIIKKIICAEMVDAPGKNDETEENIRLQIVYFEVKSKCQV
jgi:hypothetical protein